MRAIIVAALVALSAVAWWYVLAGAGTGMSVIAMTTLVFPPPIPPVIMAGAWTAGYWLTMIFMWWVMMIAMMLPPAALALALGDRFGRCGCLDRSCLASGGYAGVARYFAGYLTVWLGFSVAATALQFLLELAGLLHGFLMWSTSRWLSAALLIAAGVFQLTATKQSLLAACRRGTSGDPRGAGWRTGIGHGVACVGRCLPLMLLLYVGGIMNLAWIVGLTLVAGAERWIGAAPHWRRGSALVLIVAGIYVAGRA